MAVQDSAIYQDILDIIQGRGSVSDTRFTYSLDIISSPTTIKVKRVNSIDIGRDFMLRSADYLYLAVTVTRAEYDNFIYTNRETLTGRLYIQGVGSTDGIAGGTVVNKLYRIKLTEVEDNSLKFGDSIATDTYAKTQELKTFTIQLIDPLVEEARLKEISGVIRDSTVDDILHVLMSDNGKFKVDIHKPDKIKSINQLILPDGLSLFDFPPWLQKYGGGVYNHNLGIYSLRGWIYVYPLFDTSQHTTRRKITICAVGPGQLEGIDKTYTVNGDNISIVSAGQVEVTDTTEKLEYENGNAVRFNIPNFLGAGVSHSGGQTRLTGSGYVVHGINKSTLNRSTVHNLVTSNPFYEISRIASNRGVRATVNWDNANPGLIYPNMEVLLLYKSEDKVHSMKGVLLGMDYGSEAPENEGLKGSHQGQAKLHLYLDKTVL